MSNYTSHKMRQLRLRILEESQSPEERLRHVLNWFFTTLLEILSIFLGWYFFDWQMALIIFLVIWTQNMKAIKSE